MNKLTKNIISICILNLIAYQSFCQVAPDTILVNFLDLKSMPKYKNVIYGHKYIMKIENVNQSIFKIESAVSQQDYNIDLPDIFKGIKLPGYLNLALPNIPQDEALKNVGAAPGSTPVDYKRLIKINLAVINNSNRQILATEELNNRMKNLFSSCDKTYKDIQKELVSTVNTFLGTNSTDGKVQANALIVKLEILIQNAVTSNEALDTLVPLHLYSINLVIKRNTDNVISKWDKEPIDKKDPNYAKALFAYKNAKDENELLTHYKDSLNIVVTKASESVSEMKKFRDQNKIQGLINNYNMINYSNFTFISESIKIKSDEVTFDIKISSDKQLPCNTPTKINIKETYKTIGGLKVDFSSGVFFNGGNPDFLGRELQYKTVNDSVVIIQSKDGGARLLLSVGALMHIHIRFNGNINLAISPGLSTTTAFDGLLFHLGGSLIFGSENRIVITAGMTLRESKILDTNYNYETQYLKKDLPESPPTIKVFPKIGWFVGLTYNFTKFKKQ